MEENRAASIDGCRGLLRASQKRRKFETWDQELLRDALATVRDNDLSVEDARGFLKC